MGGGGALLLPRVRLLEAATWADSSSVLPQRWVPAWGSHSDIMIIFLYYGNRVQPLGTSKDILKGYILFTLEFSMRDIRHHSRTSASTRIAPRSCRPYLPSYHACCDHSPRASFCLASVASVSSLKHFGTGCVFPLAMPFCTPSQT